MCLASSFLAAVWTEGGRQWEEARRTDEQATEIVQERGAGSLGETTALRAGRKAVGTVWLRDVGQGPQGEACSRVDGGVSGSGPCGSAGGHMFGGRRWGSNATRCAGDVEGVSEESGWQWILEPGASSPTHTHTSGSPLLLPAADSWRHPPPGSRAFSAPPHTH